MLARKVAVRLKPNSLRKFAKLMEHDILPWLRKQPGFLDLITLVATDGAEVATITFWDDDAISKTAPAAGFPAALNLLEDSLDGVPYVKTFEVISSTLPRLAPPPPHNDTLTRDTDPHRPGWQFI